MIKPCDSYKDNSGIKAKCPSHAPHCYKNNGTDAFCSSVNHKEFCPQISHRCTSVGIFPDPRDCHYYFYCVKPSVTGPVQRRECENGMIFSEAAQGCRQSSSASDCVTVDCSKYIGNGVYSPYGSSKKYYGICYEPEKPSSDIGLPNDIVMYQCGTGAEFDSRTSTCAYKCSKSGKFANSVDPTTYFSCTVVNGKYISQLHPCLDGEEFQNNTCMPSVSVSRLRI